MSNFNMGVSPDEKIRALADQKAERAAALENLRVAQRRVSDNTRTSAILESQDAEANASIVRKDRLSSIAEKKKCATSSREAVSLENRLIKEGMESCFETALFSVVYNALPYPEEVKESLDVLEMSEVVFAMYESTLKTCKEASPLCIKKENKLVKNIKEVCEATCKKAAKRLAKKAIDENEEISSIDFELTDEEAEELDSNIKDLGIDQIEDLVKQKVVKVVEDEQKAGEDKAKAIQDIDDAISKNEKEPAGDAGLTESAEVRILNKKLNGIKSSFGNTIFESLFMSSMHEIDTTAVTEGVSASDNDIMDVAFLESVVKYTTLETMNTMGLIDFRRGNVTREINRSILKGLK